MYKLKPVIDLPNKVELPEGVIYKMPKILGVQHDVAEMDVELPAGWEYVDDDCVPQEVDPQINLLEHKQMLILQELCELKLEIEYLSTAARLADISKPPPYVRDTPEYIGFLKQEPVEAEIILYANPNSPPYFLLALQRMWDDTRFNVQIYQHSSVLAAANNNFQEYLLKDTEKKYVHNIDVKLIWKNVPDIQLVTKVYDYPLEGEANILRYLTRLIPKYLYENSNALDQTSTNDSVLDYCYFSTFEGTINLKPLCAKLNDQLKNGKWLTKSNNPSIIDIALWSALKRISQDKIPKELNSWYGSCEKTFLSN